MVYTIKFKDGSSKEFDTLRGADLRRANLRGADLRRANLRGADLSFTKGIMIFQAEQHQLIYYKNNNVYRIRVGCEDHTLEHWLNNVESIGKRNNYAKDEIDIYKNIINLFSKYELV